MARCPSLEAKTDDDGGWLQRNDLDSENLRRVAERNAQHLASRVHALIADLVAREIHQQRVDRGRIGPVRLVAAVNRRLGYHYEVMEIEDLDRNLALPRHLDVLAAADNHLWRNQPLADRR